MPARKTSSKNDVGINGEKLRIYREKKQDEAKRPLTQEKLAVKVAHLGEGGITGRQISVYEKGKTKSGRIKTTSRVRIQRIAEALSYFEPRDIEVTYDNLVFKAELKKGKSRQADKIDYMADQIKIIQNQFRFEPHLDQEVKMHKNLIGKDQEKVNSYWDMLEEYISECWELRRRVGNHPELPRHYLRIFLCAAAPHLPTQDIKNVVSVSEQAAWDQVLHILPCYEPLPMIPQAGVDLVGNESPWAQQAIVRLCREIGIAFRYRLQLENEWAFAKQSIQLYQEWNCGSNDPKKFLLRELAIGAVPSAAFSLRNNDLRDFDIGKLLISYLKSKVKDYDAPTAHATLGVYCASDGEMDCAIKHFEKLKDFAKESRVLRLDYILSYVYLGCSKEKDARKAVFQELFREPDWPILREDPFFYFMAMVAVMDIERSWIDILREIKRQGREFQIWRSRL